MPLITKFTICLCLLVLSSFTQAAHSKTNTMLTISGVEKTGVIPKYLYLLLSSEEWQKSTQCKELKLSAHHSKFIHLATEEQVPKIANKFWKNKEYVLIKIETKKLFGHLVLEKNPGGSNKYFHLYDGYIPFSDCSVID